MKSDAPMIDKTLTAQRDREIAHLQAIEGNPFDAEDDAMFAAFKRQGLSLEAQRAAIIAKARHTASDSILIEAAHTPAAE
jgi:hypothetical protein